MLALPLSLAMSASDASGAVVRERVFVMAVDDDGIEVADAPGGPLRRLRHDEIVQARTVFEWGGAAKPGSARAEDEMSTR